LKQTFDGPRQSQMLRDEFRLPANVKKARAYVTGLGFYELHLNGQRVGQDVFTLDGPSTTSGFSIRSTM